MLTVYPNCDPGFRYLFLRLCYLLLRLSHWQALGDGRPSWVDWSCTWCPRESIADKLDGG